MKMQFFKRDANKAAEKNRDSKNESHRVVATSETATATNTPATVVAETVEPEKTALADAEPKGPTDSMQQPVKETQAVPASTVTAATAEATEPTPASAAPGEAQATAPAASTAEAVTADVTHIPVPSVTSSVVIQTKGNTPGKDKEKEKMDAASTYMYGQKDEQDYVPEKKPSSSYSDSQPRTNRAQELRQSRNLKRINEEKMMREQMLKERIIKARSEMGESESEPSDEEGEPIQARLIPKSLYHKPKIHVRETVSSKFRYLFNRKPPGVTVYFKQADDKDPKKKPPFVVAAVNHCF